MEWFWFLMGCRILYSYLYEDETLSIPLDEVNEIERRLVQEAKDTPSHLDHLRNIDPYIYEMLKDRFEFHK